MNKLVKIKNLFFLLFAVSFLILFLPFDICNCANDQLNWDNSRCFAGGTMKHVNDDVVLLKLSSKMNILLFIVFVFLFSYFKCNQRDEYRSLFKVKFSRFKHSLFNNFVEFFSRGILHPKSY